MLCVCVCVWLLLLSAPHLGHCDSASGLNAQFDSHFAEQRADLDHTTGHSSNSWLLLSVGCFGDLDLSNLHAAHAQSSFPERRLPTNCSHYQVHNSTLAPTRCNSRNDRKVVIEGSEQVGMWQVVRGPSSASPNLVVPPADMPMSMALEQLSSAIPPYRTPASASYGPKLYHVMPVASPEEWTFVVLHLLTLRDVVDEFWLVESISTYSTGSHKPLYFHQLLSTLPAALRGRVRHHIVPAQVPSAAQVDRVLRMSSGRERAPSARVREMLHRNFGIEALMAAGARSEDLVLIGDADEVFDAGVLGAVKRSGGRHVRYPLHFAGPLYRYVSVGTRASR